MLKYYMTICAYMNIGDLWSAGLVSIFIENSNSSALFFSCIIVYKPVIYRCDNQKAHIGVFTVVYQHLFMPVTDWLWEEEGPDGKEPDWGKGNKRQAGT